MASFSPEGLEEVVWRVLPLAPPRILRQCRRCDGVRPFASTEKFRMNAQQAAIDVWLLYDCSDCGATWKRHVVARRSPREIGAERYARFQNNDPETAWHCAFAPHPGPVVHDEAVRVLRADAPPAPPLRIRLEVPWRCGARLDRLLAAELGRSRDELRRDLALARLAILPDGERALRRPLRDGQLILVAAASDI